MTVACDDHIYGTNLCDVKALCFIISDKRHLEQ